MTEKEKAAKGLLYNANFDEELLEERMVCKDTCHEINQLRPSDTTKQTMLKKLLGAYGKDSEIIAPFWCDYGYNIEIGEGVFINHNCVILDGAKVIIKDHVFIAPNCGISTAGHPLDVQRRKEGLEYAYPITIEEDVWIGAGVQILPGVTIGKGSVIAAGSIVNKDIPAGVVAAGNPCRILRSITAEDAMKYQ